MFDFLMPAGENMEVSKWLAASKVTDVPLPSNLHPSMLLRALCHTEAGCRYWLVCSDPLFALGI